MSGGKFLTHKMVMATFDPSSNGSERGVGAHGLGVTIPDNSILTDTFYEVVTTFTSPTGPDNATLAIHIEGANDVVNAIAINNAGNPWDAGIKQTIVGLPDLSNFHAQNNPNKLELATEIQSDGINNFVKTTADREITVTIGVEAVTAGKLNIYVEYVQGE